MNSVRSKILLLAPQGVADVRHGNPSGGRQLPDALIDLEDVRQTPCPLPKLWPQSRDDGSCPIGQTTINDVCEVGYRIADILGGRVILNIVVAAVYGQYCGLILIQVGVDHIPLIRSFGINVAYVRGGYS